MSLRLLALAVATAAPALAQPSATAAIPEVGGAGGGGHHGAMKACKADREKLCANVEPGGGRIAQCFKANLDKLSPDCKAALQARMAERKGK